MIIVIKHRYKIAEYYYLVTLTKWSQFCKQNNFLERFSNITITGKIQNKKVLSQPPITCSKLTIETLEKGVKYVQS